MNLQVHWRLAYIPLTNTRESGITTMNLMSEVFVFMNGRFLLMDHFTKYYEELAPKGSAADFGLYGSPGSYAL